MHAGNEQYRSLSLEAARSMPSATPPPTPKPTPPEIVGLAPAGLGCRCVDGGRCACGESRQPGDGWLPCGATGSPPRPAIVTSAPGACVCASVGDAEPDARQWWKIHRAAARTPPSCVLLSRARFRSMRRGAPVSTGGVAHPCSNPPPPQHTHDFDFLWTKASVWST